VTPAREYLLAHAVNLRLAARVGVRADGGFLYFPYQRPDGTRFVRRRPLDGGVTLQPKGESLCLWYPVGGFMSKAVLVCEGEADTLAAASMMCDDLGDPLEQVDGGGILDGYCPVGLPGTSFAGKAAEALNAAGVRQVVLALDGDEAGRRATNTMLAKLDAPEVVPVELPEGMDLSDWLMGAQARRADEFAHLVADHQALAEERRAAAQQGELNKVLGL
jgi:hypothetical protein